MSPFRGLIQVNHVRGITYPSLYTNPSKIQKRTTIYQIVIKVTKTLYKPYTYPPVTEKHNLTFIMLVVRRLKTLGSDDFVIIPLRVFESAFYIRNVRQGLRGTPVLQPCRASRASNNTRNLKVTRRAIVGLRGRLSV